MGEALGTVHTRERGPLRGRWWPVGPKLVFDQLTAPVPEFIDHLLYFFYIFYSLSLVATSAATWRTVPAPGR
jgi:hypothetical protein